MSVCPRFRCPVQTIPYAMWEDIDLTHQGNNEHEGMKRTMRNTGFDFTIVILHAITEGSHKTIRSDLCSSMLLNAISCLTFLLVMQKSSV
jgi:bisphosphoglycerate-dependent phosphoglycerate mutase